MPDVVDAVVIGAGPGGAVAAATLSGAGLSVTCIEQGDWTDPATYPGATPEWELVARSRWSADPDVRGNPGDYPIDSRDSDMRPGNFNGVGGGTILFNAVWPRLLPSDFEVRTRDGVADDWPLGYDELRPFYERTDRMFGVSGLEGNPAYPDGPGPSSPPLPLGPGGMRIARAHRDLGWHWWPDYNAIISTSRPGRNSCVQRGTCASGCGERAKSSADVALWSTFDGPGATLLTGACARQILLDRRGLARGVVWVDRAGRDHVVAANLVVLAANGIGTPRLLLASADDHHPDGLANSSGLLGRRLMLHPLGMVDGVFDEPLGSWQGVNGSAVQSLQFYETDNRRDFVRGSKWSLHPTGGPMAVGLPVTGPAHHDRVAERLGRTLRWCILCEDLPDESNRVELGSDSGGGALPEPVVHYRVPENSKRNLNWQVDRATESLLAAGATLTDVVTVRMNAHLMGTARMGDDPSTSVVDRWGVTHDVPNLLIADGSVFVTAGAVNPTSTIAALALRACEHLLAGRQEVSLPEHPSSFAGADVGGIGNVSTPPLPVSFPDFGDEVRQRFAVLADVLLPGNRQMPAASGVDIGGTLLDRVLAARPDLGAVLHAALTARREDESSSASQQVAVLKTGDPAGYSALVTAAVGAYYLSETVRSLLSYPGQQPRPFTTAQVPDYVTDGLLDHLLEWSAGDRVR